MKPLQKIPSTQTVVLSGATGLVGAHILLELLRNANTVLAIYRVSSNRDYVKDLLTFNGFAFEAESLKWLEYDPDLTEGLLSEIPPNAHFIHAAGTVSFDYRDYDDLLRGNQKLTRDWVNLALALRAESFTFISSIASLDMVEGSKGKKTDWKFYRRQQPYGYTKYLAELEVLRAKEEGLAIRIFNPGVVLGPVATNHSLHVFLSRVEKGLPFSPLGSTGFIGASELAHLVVCGSTDEAYRLVAVSKNLKHAQVLKLICEEGNFIYPKRELKGIYQIIAQVLAFLRVIPGLDSRSLRSLQSTSRYNELNQSDRAQLTEDVRNTVAFYKRLKASQ